MNPRGLHSEQGSNDVPLSHFRDARLNNCMVGVSPDNGLQRLFGLVDCLSKNARTYQKDAESILHNSPSSGEAIVEDSWHKFKYFLA